MPDTLTGHKSPTTDGTWEPDPSGAGDGPVCREGEGPDVSGGTERPSGRTRPSTPLPTTEPGPPGKDGRTLVQDLSPKVPDTSPGPFHPVDFPPTDSTTRGTES